MYGDYVKQKNQSRNKTYAKMQSEPSMASGDHQDSQLDVLTVRSSQEYKDLSEHPYAYLLPHIFDKGENIIVDQERVISQLRRDLTKTQLNQM